MKNPWKPATFTLAGALVLAVLSGQSQAPNKAPVGICVAPMTITNGAGQAQQVHAVYRLCADGGVEFTYVSQLGPTPCVFPFPNSGWKRLGEDRCR